MSQQPVDSSSWSAITMYGSRSMYRRILIEHYQAQDQTEDQTHLPAELGCAPLGHVCATPTRDQAIQYIRRHAFPDMIAVPCVLEKPLKASFVWMASSMVYCTRLALPRNSVLAIDHFCDDRQAQCVRQWLDASYSTCPSLPSSCAWLHLPSSG